MGKRVFLLTALAMVCCALLACQGGDKAPEKFKVGFSHSNFQEPWRVAMKNAAEKEWRENYRDFMDFTITDGKGDNGTQVANTENFIAQGIDLLIISPHEAEPQTPSVKNAFDKGIKVLVLDRRIVGDSYHCYIGGDNRQIGEAAGKWVMERFKDKENVKWVHLQGQSGATPTRERREGFLSVIGDNPKFEKLADQFCDYQRDKAMSAMENILQANPEIDLVYTHNDPMAIGASLAATAANRRGQMVIIGIDALCDPDGGVQAVIDGKIDVTFVYPPLGKEAVQLAAKMLQGESVDKDILLDTTTIDASNAQQYMDENR